MIGVFDGSESGILTFLDNIKAESQNWTYTDQLGAAKSLGIKNVFSFREELELAQNSSNTPTPCILFDELKSNYKDKTGGMLMDSTLVLYVVESYEMGKDAEKRASVLFFDKFLLELQKYFKRNHTDINLPRVPIITIEKTEIYKMGILSLVKPFKIILQNLETDI